MTLKIRFWHFLTAIFGHLASLMKKSHPFLWSVQSYLQSEMFLSNSVDMMKNLHMDCCFVDLLTLFIKSFLRGPYWKFWLILILNQQMAPLFLHILEQKRHLELVDLRKKDEIFYRIDRIWSLIWPVRVQTAKGRVLYRRSA